MKKKMSTLALTAVLLSAMAVPVFAAGSNNGTGAAMNGNGVRTQDNTMMDRTPAANNFNRATAPMRNAVRDVGQDLMPDAVPRTDTRYRTNTVRTTAAADNDIDWGWLGLVGLIGLAGLRGRERSK